MGRAAVRRARDRLELRELERPEGLEKLEALDKRVAFEHLARKFDPEAPLFVDYEEHLDSYSGTDRAPVTRDR
jgi:coenzyme F420 hydrogenase subunit beta